MENSSKLSSPTVSLRPVTADDEEFLFTVYAGSREQELNQVVWEEGQREQFVRWQFSMQRQEYQTRYPDARYEVILVDGEPAGRIWVGTDSEQIRLLDIAIVPEHQNRGVGTFLLRQLMDEATQEAKPLRHMVFVLNDNASRFYERIGFHVIEDLGGYKHMQWTPETVSKPDTQTA
jgi:ribosomal protein S18 acetylase RimI-like enzyme